MTEAISVKAAAILIYFNSEFSSSELNFNSRDKFVQLLFLELNFLLALIRFKFKRTVNFCSLGSENWIEQHIAVLIRSKCIRYTHSFCHPLQLLKYIILFPSFWCGKLRGEALCIEREFILNLVFKVVSFDMHSHQYVCKDDIKWRKLL